MAEKELRATQRFLLLAQKHEGTAVAAALAEDAAYLDEVVRVYGAHWHRCSEQWVRYWAALQARVAVVDPES